MNLKFFLLFVLLILLFNKQIYSILPNKSFQEKSVKYNYEVRYYQQVVDHFGFTLPIQNFSQRYLVDFEYWKPGGPIFFYTGNEGDIEWFASNTGFMWETASLFAQSGEYFPCIIFSEHRYYGESIVPGQNDNPPNLRYLTAEQALADHATLVTALKQSTPGLENSPVIAIGGSYGGMLSAWIRMRYPHIFVGSLAASAPILQFAGMTENTTIFYDITTRDYTSECANTIRESWELLRAKAKEPNGLQILTEEFKLCTPLTDVNDLINWFVNGWTYLAMVDYPYPANFLEPLPGNPIDYLCELMHKSSGDIIEKVRVGINVYYNYTGSAPCFNLSQSATANLSDLQWNYQACTEMIFPMSTTGIEDMFEPSVWNYPEYVQYCKSAFHVEPHPWSGGGVLQSISDTLIAIIIPSGAHHLDLRYSNPLDPQDVIQARDIERQWFKKWIDEYNYNSFRK
ncbi:lysosomal pro-x carboxypeptidase [Anaeramoeba ignava]|uniref:Lysosomal pro-x carboxypeptidase n=1 Tax=Anaeramoeba ignava TaxID=1746090 RepID=A0A9Q0LRF8_ANAIG|nr:lysosomal pro-x carboxypeptidase [Anaeramoeba ignava]